MLTRCQSRSTGMFIYQGRSQTGYAGTEWIFLQPRKMGTTTISDASLLDRSTALGRILVTFDSDLLAEAHHRQQESLTFAGIIYVNVNRTSIGEIISDLELLALSSERDHLLGRVEYLPL